MQYKFAKIQYGKISDIFPLINYGFPFNLNIYLIMILKKLLFTIFYITPSCFSSIRFEIIPHTPKIVNCFISVLFFTRFVNQQVNKTFTVEVEIITDFIRRFSDKARNGISYVYPCPYLKSRVTAL